MTVARQLPLSPIRLFRIGIEHPFGRMTPMRANVVGEPGDGDLPMMQVCGYVDQTDNDQRQRHKRPHGSAIGAVGLPAARQNFWTLMSPLQWHQSACGQPNIQSMS